MLLSPNGPPQANNRVASNDQHPSEQEQSLRREKALREKLMHERAKQEEAAENRRREAAYHGTKAKAQHTAEACRATESLTNRKDRVTISDIPLAMQGGNDMNLRKDFLRNHIDIKAIVDDLNAANPTYVDYTHVTVNRRQTKDSPEPIATQEDITLLMTIVSLKGRTSVRTCPRNGRCTHIIHVEEGETWTFPLYPDRSWGHTVDIHTEAEDAAWLELRTGHGMQCKD